MTALTLALVDYWTALPSRTKSARLRTVEDLRRRVDSGTLEPAVLLPPALGDADEEVVFRATSAWLSAHEDVVAAAGEASEWVRRGLAINRGAVFAALLALAEEAVNERLLRLRLVLSSDDVETLCRCTSRRNCPRTRAFFGDWLDLLEGAAAARERASLADVLSSRVRVA